MGNDTSGLSKLTDTVESMISGVPSPLRKNFFKALSQLSTAAINIPTTWLEGKSAEIKASYEARVQIIKRQGDNIAENIETPKEYITKASEKYASKVIKEQLNLDQIALNAANNLISEGEKNKEDTTEEISDDWLNEFENYGRLKSSDDMKLIFGKLLSGEISKPGTFSIRTIRLISQLDNDAAKLFQRLCSLSISMHLGGKIISDARVVSFQGSAASNSLSKYGLSFDNLNILQEYGLIITDYNSYMPYPLCVIYENNRIAASIVFGNKHYGLLPTDNDKYDKELKLSGVTLTKAATELLPIIPLEEVPEYKSDLETFFENKFLKLQLIK
ncbi:DUF2806 domain-containing protein [Sphingobacterium tabacisoli]|uniref:DUF2806 domain-containing protein n=1 Tax=Sphingobacterium tabacisoli TaxID=2044855 RepID=A0ABW5L245_9SPHI|nr:DUF2806 domain-containing protein [Sphingobacterium tabacisoli]